MSAKAPSAKELVDSVEIQLDTPIVLEIINCLRQRLVKGHNDYELTSEQSHEISVGDITYLKLLGYGVYEETDDDDDDQVIYNVFIARDMLDKKVAASGAKRARTA